MSPLEAAFALVVLTVGATVQGSVGFGLALIAAPFLLLINPGLVPGPLVAVALVLSLLMSFRESHAIDRRGLFWALVGRLPGTILGAWAVQALPLDKMGLALAGIIIAAVAMSASGVRFKINTATLLGAGALGGFMGTVSAVGGPPIALVYQDAAGPRIRGTLSAFFVVGCVMSLAALHGVDRFGGAEIKASLWLLPGVFVGYALSRKVAPFIDRGYTRPAVLAVSALAAAIVIIDQLT